MCACMQRAYDEELVGRVQPRQLLGNLPLNKPFTSPVHWCVSEEIAFINMFN